MVFSYQKCDLISVTQHVFKMKYQVYNNVECSNLFNDLFVLHERQHPRRTVFSANFSGLPLSGQFLLVHTHRGSLLCMFLEITLFLEIPRYILDLSFIIYRQYC